MLELTLEPHPQTPPSVDLFLNAQVYQDRVGLHLIFDVNGDVAAIVRPAPAKPYRADGLWRTTCFEAFIAVESGAYLEFNFSPSGEWAAYAFEDYRAGMKPLAVESIPIIEWPPSIWSEYGTDYGDGLLSFHLGASLGRAQQGAALALSAVIEETDGTKSYWALAHAPGPPDFHNPACFTATLPPPAA